MSIFGSSEISMESIIYSDVPNFMTNEELNSSEFDLSSQSTPELSNEVDQLLSSYPLEASNGKSRSIFCFEPFLLIFMKNCR